MIIAAVSHCSSLNGMSRLCLVGFVAVYSWGCASPPPAGPEVVIDRIVPSAGPEGESTLVRIEGRGFRLALQSDLDNGTLLGEVAVTIGGVMLKDVVLLDEGRLEAVVPSTLALGTYDLVVSLAQGRQGRLSNAYQVLSAVPGRNCEVDADCDDGDPCTEIERCLDNRCLLGPRIDKDDDQDGFIDASCGGDDCDDSDNQEFPGQRWYPDADGDSYGDALAAGSECTRGDASDVLDNTDCDDKTTAVFPGAICDDGSGCTDDDICFAGRCGGHNTCASECADGCGGGCGGSGDCCIEDCQGECASCQSGCSCDQLCSNDDTCNTRCEVGSVCHLFANSTTNVELACEGASCSLACNSVSACTLDCQVGSSCVIECNSVGDCDLGCWAGPPVECGDGVQVCNRACPAEKDALAQ